MTITKPDYTITIPGTTAHIKLSDGTGSIRLSASSAPHVTADVTIPYTGQDMLVQLDPRTEKRVILTCGPRTFNLGVREVQPDYVNSTLRLTLASDEALLTDIVQAFTAAWNFYDNRGSLRTIVNRVLGLLPTPVFNTPHRLETSTIDADMTPYWPVTNYVRNPAVAVNTLNWTADYGCSIAFIPQGSSGAVGVTATAAQGAVYAIDKAMPTIPATGGQKWTAAFLHRSEGDTGQGAAGIAFLDAENRIIRSTFGKSVPITTTYVQVEHTAIAPPSAVRVAPYWIFDGSASGRQYRIDAALLHTSPFPVERFTGGNADDDHYSYEFEGQSNDSASVRTPHSESDPAALVWDIGITALDFLSPLLQRAGIRLVCNEKRQWTLRPAEYLEPGSIIFKDKVNVLSAGGTLTREGDGWYDGAIYIYRWTDERGIAQVRWDQWGLDLNPSKMRVFNIDRPFPGIGRAEKSVRRVQARAQQMTLRRQADWTEAAEQLVSVEFPGAPQAVGTAETVEFDLATNEVTVTTRTREVPADSWQALPAGRRWVDELVGMNWTQEEVTTNG